MRFNKIAIPNNKFQMARTGRGGGRKWKEGRRLRGSKDEIR